MSNYIMHNDDEDDDDVGVFAWVIMYTYHKADGWCDVFPIEPRGPSDEE